MYYVIDYFRYWNMENSTGIKRTIDENESIEVKKQKTDKDMGLK